MQSNRDLYKQYKSRCSSLKKENIEHLDYAIFTDYENFKDIFTDEEFKAVMRIKKARHNKRTRTNDKIQDMLRYFTHQVKLNNRKLYLVFGTGTINDTYMNREPRTRDKLLNAYLTNHYDVAIINTDIGDHTERLHYHWIGITDLEPIPKLNAHGKQAKSNKGRLLYVLPTTDYKLGHNPTVEPIVTTDMEKIKNYLLKLDNHSNKEGTGRIRYFKNAKFRLWDLLDNDKYYNRAKKKVLRKMERKGLL